MTTLVASAPIPTFFGVGGIHPWRRLDELVGWELRWHTPEEGPDKGFTLHDERAISLRSDLTWAERRCAVLHETLHAVRGETLDGVLHQREALVVGRIVARMMLPDIKFVGKAMAWALSTEECADELMVNVDVLRDRLRCCT